MANWLSGQLTIGEGSSERLIHYETDTKNIVDFEQATNDLIDNKFNSPVLKGTVNIENLVVDGTSDLHGNTTCHSDLEVQGTFKLPNNGLIETNNGWSIVSTNPDGTTTLSVDPDSGLLSYDGKAKFTDGLASPLKLPYTTITSNNGGTTIATASGSYIVLSNGNDGVTIKTKGGAHTLALSNDGKVTIDGKDLLTKQEMMNLEHPVGSVYFTFTDTNPNSILGVGTWTKMGAGLQLAIVGTAKDTNSTSHTFVAGTNAGEWSHAITVSEMASHNHTISISSGGAHGHGASCHSAGNHYHGAMGEHYEDTLYGKYGDQKNTHLGSSGGIDWDDYIWRTSTDGAHSHSITINSGGAHGHGASIGNSGGGSKHNNIEPSFGIYLWKRTA